MEVRIVDSSGMSSDTIVQIRVGSLRRQAKLSAGLPFAFPTLPLNSNPFKVEVFKPLSGKSVALSADAEQYNVRLPPIEDGGLSSKLQLLIQERSNTLLADEDATIPALAATAVAVGEGQDTSSKGPEAAVAARQYLQDHDLLNYIQDLLSKVLKERPSQPFSFMSRHAGARDGTANFATLPVGAAESEARAKITAPEPPPIPVSGAGPLPEVQDTSVVASKLGPQSQEEAPKSAPPQPTMTCKPELIAEEGAAKSAGPPIKTEAEDSDHEFGDDMLHEESARTDSIDATAIAGDPAMMEIVAGAWLVERQEAWSFRGLQYCTLTTLSNRITREERFELHRPGAMALVVTCTKRKFDEVHAKHEHLVGSSSVAATINLLFEERLVELMQGSTKATSANLAGEEPEEVGATPQAQTEPEPGVGRGVPKRRESFLCFGDDESPGGAKGIFATVSTEAVDVADQWLVESQEAWSFHGSKFCTLTRSVNKVTQEHMFQMYRPFGIALVLTIATEQLNLVFAQSQLQSGTSCVAAINRLFEEGLEELFQETPAFRGKDWQPPTQVEAPPLPSRVCAISHSNAPGTLPGTGLAEAVHPSLAPLVTHTLQDDRDFEDRTVLGVETNISDPTEDVAAETALAAVEDMMNTVPLSLSTKDTSENLQSISAAAAPPVHNSQDAATAVCDAVPCVDTLTAARGDEFNLRTKNKELLVENSALREEIERLKHYLLSDATPASETGKTRGSACLQDKVGPTAACVPVSIARCVEASSDEFTATAKAGGLASTLEDGRGAAPSSTATLRVVSAAVASDAHGAETGCPMVSTITGGEELSEELHRHNLELSANYRQLSADVSSVKAERDKLEQTLRRVCYGLEGMSTDVRAVIQEETSTHAESSAAQ